MDKEEASAPERQRDSTVFSPAGQAMKNFVIADFKKLCKEYEKRMLQLKMGRSKPFSRYKFSGEIITFLQIYFCKEEIMAYQEAGKNGATHSHNLVDTVQSLSIKKIKNNHKKLAQLELITKHSHQLNHLKQLLNRLVNSRSQSAVQSNSADNDWRYNLWIEYSGKKGKKLNQSTLLLSKDFICLYLKKHTRGKENLLINGISIINKKVTQIKITATTLTNKEIVQFKKDHDINTDEEFAEACPDVTNELQREAERAQDKARRKSASPADNAPVFPGFSKPSSATDSMVVKKFIKHLIRCIQLLQKQWSRQECIRLIRSGKGQRESSIRDFFEASLDGSYEFIEVELMKGYKRIDLTVKDNDSGAILKVEFKGYWNDDKHLVVQQLVDYLTDFEDVGFIIIINDTNRDISEFYHQLVAQPATQFIPGSWKKHIHPEKGYVYYSSEHQVGNRVVKLFHFILSIPRSKEEH